MEVDWTILLTGIGSVAAIAGINVALFSWLRTDIKEIRTEMAADRRDILQLMRQIQRDAQDFKEVMASELRDYHGRLCAIEERNKGK